MSEAYKKALNSLKSLSEQQRDKCLEHITECTYPENPEENSDYYFESSTQYRCMGGSFGTCVNYGVPETLYCKRHRVPVFPPSVPDKQAT